MNSEGWLVVLDGSTFAVSGCQGDMDTAADPVVGLYFRDMRHLSHWVLTVDGEQLELLTHHGEGYDEAVIVLALAGAQRSSPDPVITIHRHRSVGHGMREHLAVQNAAANPVSLVLRLAFDADFADLFEVKDRQPKRGHHHCRLDGRVAVLGYSRGGFARQTRISCPDGTISPGELRFDLTVAGHDRWETTIELGMVTGQHHHTPKPRPGQPNMEQSLADWLANAPGLDCDWDVLRHTYQRSLTDLAALRFYPPTVPGPASLPAAGLPWYMALFGRDAIITSYLALPFVPELAASTLRALAARQATAFDSFRDAEPGKILHELRHGELVHFKERPQSPYYGAADATPLFLVLLDEYERWTADAAMARDLEPQARAALGWIEGPGDLDGDGYLEYRTRNPASGLANQSWKDSGDAIVHPDGRLASLPRATCELQGYAYAARRSVARLARDCWDDPDLAARLDREADELQARFDRDFWVGGDDDGFYALALDGAKEPVATVASNMGHLLWSGIVPRGRRALVARRLLEPDLFSGWGIRTLAQGQGAYNPVGYHVGTVWPHDNTLIALGLARCGARTEAGRVAHGILEAAGSFRYRLPEAFAGFSRQELSFPVAYPSACSPQAWAAASPLGLLRAVLGLEAADGTVTTSPAVPDGMGAIALHGIHGPWGPAGASSSPGPHRRRRPR